MMSQSPSMNDIVFTPFKSQPNFENIATSRNNKKRKSPSTNSSNKLKNNILFTDDHDNNSDHYLREKFILENFHYNIKDYRNSITEVSFPKYSNNL